LAKYFTREYFGEVQAALASDPKWAESSKSMKSSILLSSTDTGQSFVLSVEGGVTTIQDAQPGASAEFSFEGTYDTWCRLASGELDLQSAVLKGQLKFKGSITKILMYRERFTRIAEVMRGVPVET
jgi:putative sterol carrier protein